jgi:hypothetical protein
MQDTFASEMKWSGWFGCQNSKLGTYTGSQGLQDFKNNVTRIENGNVDFGPPRVPLMAWGFDSAYVSDKLWKSVDDIAQYFNVAQSTYPKGQLVRVDVRYESGMAPFKRSYVSVIVPNGPVRMWHWWQTQDMYDRRSNCHSPSNKWD